MKLSNILVLIRNMLEYDRIDLSEGDVNKCKDTSKKWAHLILYLCLKMMLLI